MSYIIFGTSKVVIRGRYLQTSFSSIHGSCREVRTQWRYLSNNASGNKEPILNTQDMQNTIIHHAPQIARDLANNGYYTTTNFLPSSMISLLRSQAITLRNMGRFEQSWSEKIINGKPIRFDKEGVEACEPDGRDYYDAPDLIVYMSVLLQTLPVAINNQPQTNDVDLSNSSFNAKLAVTLPGSKYPLHIDNPQGILAGDTRKLTCILYLNPFYKKGNGGELRLLLPPAGDKNDCDDKDDKSSNKQPRVVDLTPEGGRILLFWSDEIPHEVLPTLDFPIKQHAHTDEDEGSSNVEEDSSTMLDRYALTVWIPTENMAALHNESSKFRELKDLAF